MTPCGAPHETNTTETISIGRYRPTGTGRAPRFARTIESSGSSRPPRGLVSVDHALSSAHIFLSPHPTDRINRAAVAEHPIIPDYRGPCVSNVVPALVNKQPQLPSWLPALVEGASQVVLLAVDGLGWEQLQARAHLAPGLASMTGGPIVTVAPST